MPQGTFYQTVAQLSFTLLGLWWLILQAKYQEWIGAPLRRRMATNITLFFLLPGAMSLLALLATSERLIWRIAFIAASVIGLIATAVLMRDTSGGHTNRWHTRLAQGVCGVALVVYALIAVVAAFPALAGYIGLEALTVAGLLVTTLTLAGLVLAWAYYVEPVSEPREKRHRR